MSNMKCPFCGKKLFYDEQYGIYRCMKSACVMDYEGGTAQLWKALIDGKAAQDALKQIKNMNSEDYYNAYFIDWAKMVRDMQKIASITTQEKENG